MLNSIRIIIFTALMMSTIACRKTPTPLDPEQLFLSTAQTPISVSKNDGKIVLSFQEQTCPNGLPLTKTSQVVLPSSIVSDNRLGLEAVFGLLQSIFVAITGSIFKLLIG